MGYFACAQYDVLFASPEGGSAVYFTVFAKERSDCGNPLELKYGVYAAYSFSGIATPAARNDVKFEGFKPNGKCF